MVLKIDQQVAHRQNTDDVSLIRNRQMADPSFAHHAVGIHRGSVDVQSNDWTTHDAVHRDVIGVEPFRHAAPDDVGFTDDPDIVALILYQQRTHSLISHQARGIAQRDISGNRFDIAVDEDGEWKHRFGVDRAPRWYAVLQVEGKFVTDEIIPTQPKGGQAGSCWHCGVSP